MNFNEELVHTQKAPGPALAEGKFLPRTPNNYPYCLGVALCCKGNEKCIALFWPVQLRVLLGSGVHPGWNPPFPGGQAVAP